MTTLILIDRDGTIIYDDKYYLGKTNDWQQKIHFLDTVIQGIQLLNQLPDSKIYMITNQKGIAVENFPLLTEERADAVCEEILQRLKKNNAYIDDYFVCPHATPEYVEKHPEREFNSNYVCNCDCIKPNLGMVKAALENEGISFHNVNLYVIGDRASDVKTALTVDGSGILVPFENEPGQKEEVRELGSQHTYVAKHFLDAAEFIASKENST